MNAQHTYSYVKALIGNRKGPPKRAFCAGRYRAGA